MKLTDTQLQALLADSAYQNIGALPSQFHGYDWNELYIRPFRINEFKLVSKAAAMKDMSHMIRAIDLVITQDASNLTIGDFYYVMMWLRIHSLPKSPLVVDWHCEEQVLKHKETGQLIFNDANFKQPEDISEYELIDCDTQNTEMAHMSSLEIISLEEEGVEIPPGFDFPRAKHIEGISAGLADAETALLMAALQWAAGDTVAERMSSILNDAENGVDRLHTAEALNEKYTHGLREVITLHCRTCRHEEPYVININPQSFFR